jgi:hypothetical protein
VVPCPVVYEVGGADYCPICIRKISLKQQGPNAVNPPVAYRTVEPCAIEAAWLVSKHYKSKQDITRASGSGGGDGDGEGAERETRPPAPPHAHEPIQRECT